MSLHVVLRLPMMLSLRASFDFATETLKYPAINEDFVLHMRKPNVGIPIETQFDKYAFIVTPMVKFNVSNNDVVATCNNSSYVHVPIYSENLVVIGFLVRGEIFPIPGPRPFIYVCL